MLVCRKINGDMKEREKNADQDGCQDIKTVVAVKFCIAKHKMIIRIQNTRSDGHLQDVQKQASHFFWFCCFLICWSRLSNSSTEILFSFTKKETTLLNEPSK